MLPTKFQFNWPFRSGDETKNRLSRWQPWWPSLIYDRKNFSYFLSTSHPYAFYQVSSQLAFWCRYPDARHPDASYQVSSQLAQGCRRSRLLKQIVDSAWRTTHNRHMTTDIDRSQQLTMSISCSVGIKSQSCHFCTQYFHLVLFYISTKYHKNIPKGIRLTVQTRNKCTITAKYNKGR